MNTKISLVEFLFSATPDQTSTSHLPQPQHYQASINAPQRRYIELAASITHTSDTFSPKLEETSPPSRPLDLAITAPPTPRQSVRKHPLGLGHSTMSFETTKMPPYNASDPSATFLSSSALDFLLIELVPLAKRIASERDAAPVPRSSPSPDSAEDMASGVVLPSASASARTGAGAGATEMDEDEDLAVVRHRLDVQGYRVGQGLVERFSRDRPRFNDTLDVIKFLCKDLWSLVFGKNIDNLKTNHRVRLFSLGCSR